jgi:hypothetical protein
MHTNRISPARKIIVWLALAASLVLLAGCETVTLTNLTPPSTAENPSQIYTFSLRITPRTNTVPRASIEPHIIIDGKSFNMKPSTLGADIYEFEYSVAAGRDQIAYYYLVNYSIEGNATQTTKEAYTDVAALKIARRYVLQLEANRGPVGARISVVGRGLTSQDAIAFNGTPIRTMIESPNALSFNVPPLEAGRNYQVTLMSPAGNAPVGTFRIDPSTITVFPTALTLRTGQRQVLSFTLPNPAPLGGIPLDITTDVPDSVIMPEVSVQQGQAMASVEVEGGKPGNGSLFLKGFGAGEITIPVTVTAR